MPLVSADEYAVAYIAVFKRSAICVLGTWARWLVSGTVARPGLADAFRLAGPR